MSQEKKSAGMVAMVLKNPLLYVILLWTALGFVLTPVFEKIGIETAKANAWQIANFLILLSVLYYFGKDPLKEYLSKRRTEIGGSIDEAKKMLEDTERSSQDYEYKMEWIEDDLAGIESRIREEGDRERIRLMEEAQKQIERIRHEAEFTANQELKAAEALLKEEAIRSALRIAEEILKSKLGDQDEARLLEEYLQEVERGG